LDGNSTHDLPIVCAVDERLGERVAVHRRLSLDTATA
jgi:hypothetical protein